MLYYCSLLIYLFNTIPFLCQFLALNKVTTLNTMQQLRLIRLPSSCSIFFNCPFIYAYLWWRYLFNNFFIRFGKRTFQISSGWPAGLFVYIDVCESQILFQYRVIKFHILYQIQMTHVCRFFMDLLSFLIIDFIFVSFSILFRWWISPLYYNDRLKRRVVLQIVNCCDRSLYWPGSLIFFSKHFHSVFKPAFLIHIVPNRLTTFIFSSSWRTSDWSFPVS